MSANLPAFRDQMAKMQVEYAKVLPAHITPDRLNRIAVTAVQNNPKLLECDRGSLLSSIMTAAVLGLEPDGVTGQGYLVPFKGKVTFIPGYKGLITLAHNSGFTLEGHLVRQNDIFSYQMGTDPYINHATPGIDEERGGVIGAYATARSLRSPTVFKVMSIADIKSVRDKSPSAKYGSSPWATDFEAMARKTVVRRLGGSLPLNVQRAFAIEDAHDRGQQAHIQPDGDLVVEGEIIEPGSEADGE